MTGQILLFKPFDDNTYRDGLTWQQTELPPKEQTQQVIDGELEVFRLTDGRFEELVPIDDEDTDSWNEIHFGRP